LVRGLCSVCSKEVGGLLKSKPWQCPKCRSLFCRDCPKKEVGRLFKKPMCPNCSIELKEGGLENFRSSWWLPI